MRKKVLQLLLVPVMILVCSNVAMSRGPAPPGTESKTCFADLQDCQLQDYYQVAEAPAPVPAQDIWHPDQQVYQVAEAPAILPGPGIFHPDQRTERCNSKEIDSGPMLDKKHSKILYRWGEPDHPLRE